MVQNLIQRLAWLAPKTRHIRECRDGSTLDLIQECTRAQRFGCALPIVKIPLGFPRIHEHLAQHCRIKEQMMRALPQGLEQVKAGTPWLCERQAEASAKLTAIACHTRPGLPAHINDDDMIVLMSKERWDNRPRPFTTALGAHKQDILL